jgi:putative peptidoglycan lipid II flippase
MSLLKSAATVGGFTLVSRLLGFVRDQLIAFTLGTGPIAEALFVAQRFPNLFRALFAEGAFNSAFVPQFAKKVEADGLDQAMTFARDMFSVMLAWMIVFSAVAMIFMPWLMTGFAWGFQVRAGQLDYVTELTRICFPYLLLMTLTALQSGVLNSMHRFTAAAAAPILLNIVMITSNIVAWYFATGNSETTGRIFAWGITVAGVAQFALLQIACRRAGVPLLPSFPKLTADVKRVIAKSVPGIISGGVVQINLVVATMIATGFASAVPFLYYADRLFQLPLGMVGVAIGVVLLPTLSRKLRAGDQEGAADSQNRALETSLFLTLPAALALAVIGLPIIRTVYEHGAFSRADSFQVAPALAAFAFGLPAFTLTKIFQPGFFAREDTTTPMRFAIIAVIVNVIASFLLSRNFQHVGLAAGTSISAWVNAGLLIFTSLRRGLFVPDARLRDRLPRMLLSLAVMAVVLYGALYLLEPNYAEGAGFARAAWGLLILVTVGTVSYFSVAHVSGAFTLGEMRRMFRRT